MNRLVADPHAPPRGEFARRFFLLSTALLAIAGGTAWLLIQLLPTAMSGGSWRVPPAFGVSTALLLAGSVLLQRGLGFVRIERQKPFRRSLLLALAVGTAFVAVQTYGLWCILPARTVDAAETGSAAFVFVFALLHGMHFSIALLCVVFVTLRALADRYDHEYYWGVTVCAYFWHFLGGVWMCILGVLTIAGH